MNKPSSLLLAFLLLLVTTTHAQFNKPLRSSGRTGSSEARYNIGLVGGATSTYWMHFEGTNTKYSTPFNYGLIGGLSIERMLNRNNAVSLEGYYAMRNTELNYYVPNVPVAVNENKDYFRQFNADYQEVDVQAIYTQYFSKGNLRPYVFAGPRLSVPLAGNMVWKETEVFGYGTSDQQLNQTPETTDTVVMNAQNTRQLNVGLVAGIGLLYKLRIGNYYLLLKADVSAHSTTLNSFTKEEIAGESQNVIGASHIDPYLLGKRYNTDITAKVTLMFPLKKMLQGACISWGEY